MTCGAHAQPSAASTRTTRRPVTPVSTTSSPRVRRRAHRRHRPRQERRQDDRGQRPHGQRARSASASPRSASTASAPTTSPGSPSRASCRRAARSSPRPTARSTARTTPWSISRSCRSTRSLGRVVIGRAGGEGAVEVSGPTTLAEVRAHGRPAPGARRRAGPGRRRHQPPRQRLAARERRPSIMATGGIVADTLDEAVETTAGHARDADPARGRPADAAASLTAADPGRRARRLRRRARPRRGARPRHRRGRGRHASRARSSAWRTRTLFVGGALTQEFVDDFLRVLPPRRKLRRRRARRHGAHPAAGDRVPVPAPRHRPARAHAAARAGRDRQPVPVPAAVQPEDLLRRGRRRSRRPRARVRRRQRPGRGAGRRRRERSRDDDSPRRQGRCDSARRDHVSTRRWSTRAREAADAIADDIQRTSRSTPPTRPSAPRCACWASPGVNEIDVPLVNVVVEQARDLLPGGIVRPFVDLMMRRPARDAQEVAEGVAAGDLALDAVPAERRAAVEARAASSWRREGVARIDAVRAPPRRARRQDRRAAQALRLRHRRHRQHLRGRRRRPRRPRAPAPTWSPSSARRPRACSTTCPTARPPRASAAPTPPRRTSASCAPPSTRSAKSSAATSASATTPAACACPRSPPWAPSSAST